MNDSVRIRTDTTLDQDCVLKANVHVCTACMIVSLLTTCLNLNTPPLGCTFSMQDSQVKRGSTTGHKTQQARLPAESDLHNSTFPSLVNCILTVSECQGDHHGSCTSTMVLPKCLLSLSSSRILGLLKVLRQFTTWRQSVHKISFCLLLLLCACSCFAHCCHDPFIVRSASNLSTVPWFHSVCASVSMLTIINNCLFLFLFLFLFLGRYLNTTRASVQPSRPLHLHRSKPPLVHTKSVYARTKSAYLLKCAHTGSADFAPDPSSACHQRFVVECGIHGL